MKHKSRWALWIAHGLVLWRRRGASLLLILAAAVSVFSTMALHNLTSRQQRALNQTVASTAIQCIVTDAKGISSDHLDMFSAYVDILTGKGQRDGCDLEKYVTGVRALASLPLSHPADYALRKILSISSDKALDPVEGATLEFYEGWDESALLGDQAVCLVPDTLVPQPDEDGCSYITVGFLNGSSQKLKVIGVFTNGPANVIYCPFYLKQTDGVHEVFRVDSCSFCIRDNAKLSESRAAIYQQFLEPSLSNQEDGIHFGVLIQDETYLKTVSEIEANLNMLHILLPVLFFLCVCIGFFTSYLTTRSRTREFAVMRCIGMRQSRIFGIILGELAVLTVLGALLGTVGGMLLERTDPFGALANAALIAGVFLLGSAIAAIRITGVNIMKLMKVED